MLVDDGEYKTDGMYRSGGPKDRYSPDELQRLGRELADDFHLPALDRVRKLRTWLSAAIAPHIDGPLDPQAVVRGEVTYEADGWFEHLTLSTGAGCYYVRAERHTWIEDCVDALRENNELEEALASTGIERVVRLSFRQGQLVQRIVDRALFARSALFGSRKSRKSQLQAELTNRKRAAKRPDYAAAVKSVMTRKKLAYTPACRAVAEQFDVTFETVRNNTPQLRPGRKYKTKRK
jgi:hypothetical protein